MGPRLRVVEIALQAGESASATSGFCGLSCASGAPGARAGRRDIQIPSFDRIDKYRITVIPCINPARHPIDRYRGADPVRERYTY